MFSLRKTVGRLPLYKLPNAVPSLLMQDTHRDTSLFHNGDFKSRDSDIWVVTCIKSGSTWTQQIVCELLYGADDNLKPLIKVPLPELSTWLPRLYKLAPKHTVRLLEGQSHRRVFKCHEPIEALPFNPKNKHIVLVRDFRDVIWSAHNHFVSIKWFVRWIFNAPTRYSKRPFPKLAADYSAIDFWEQMTKSGDMWGNPDGAWLWSLLWITGSWMNAVRTNPSLNDSILFVHYMDLYRDPLVEMKRVADFIGVEVSSERLLEVREKTTLEAMRSSKVLGMNERFFKGGNATFFKKGGSRRGDWQSQLTGVHLDRYYQLADYYMHADDVQFMENGSSK